MEILQYQFMQHAFAAAILGSVICGIIGTLVVVNRIVFLAGAIAHAAYGGVGLSFFIGTPVLPTTVLFSLGTSAVLSYATEKNIDRADSFIGVLWAVGMALGIILIDLTPGYNADLMSFLFGSILAVSISDLILMSVLLVFIISFTLIFYRKLLSVSFDREYAVIKGISVKFIHYSMIGLISASIVIMIKIVGLILVIALFSIPQNIVERGSNSLSSMMIKSTLVCLVSFLSGIYLSYVFDISSGAVIVVTSALIYLIFAVFRKAVNGSK